MSEQRVVALQKSLVATCALVALVLLASFYMVVSAAVQRGPRLARVESAIQQPTAAVAQRGASRGGSLLARVGN